MTYPKFKNKHLYEALFGPKDSAKYRVRPKNIPHKYILVYSDSALNYIKKKYKPKATNIFDSFTINICKGVGFVQIIGIGSPTASFILEGLIALGGRKFINIGTAGGLISEGVFLCIKALRDEGTSYHYIPHGHYSYPNKELTRKLGEAMKKQGINYKTGITWTIDAPYRETKKEIEHYSRIGVATVEMEASALFAVAQYRKVKITAAFVVSDILGKKWEPKFHKLDVKKTLNKLIDSAVDCLS